VVTLAAPAGADGNHTVRRGETASEIAAANHTTVRALAQANGLTNPNRIIEGQVLVIPGPRRRPRRPSSTSSPPVRR
jgi:putative chitinase